MRLWWERTWAATGGAEPSSAPIVSVLDIVAAVNAASERSSGPDEVNSEDRDVGRTSAFAEQPGIEEEKHTAISGVEVTGIQSRLSSPPPRFDLIRVVYIEL